MQSNNRRPTIADIADALGYSRNTVSRALNGHSGLTSATRSRILAKARELNYKSMGDTTQKAPSQIKKDILLICNDGQLHDNAFFFTLIQALLTEIRSHQATPIVQFVSLQDIEKEHIAQTAQKVAGIIALDTLNPAYISQLLSLGRPTVFYDYYHQYDLIDRPCDVVISDALPLRQIIRRMYDRGARSFGFVGIPEHCIGFQQRYITFNETLRELGVSSDGLFNLRFPEDVGTRPLADAYICANDYIALPLLQHLTRLGKQIPGNVQVCGFDGINHGLHSQPQLTTVSVSPESLAANLALMLFDRIEHPSRGRRLITQDCQITYRDSTK